MFVEAFTKSYTSISKSVSYPNILSMRIVDSLTSIIFDSKTVEDLLNKIKISTSPGLDLLSPLLLRSCSRSLSLPLSLIMQKSFNEGCLPDVWKTASVTPIFKKGDKLDVNNYRPISLTPIVTKIMERIIVTNMYRFCAQHNIIPKTQHGFMPGRSVVTNLLTCINDWTLALNNNHPIDVIYLDFSKAFDKVPHAALLLKLDHTGFRGQLLSWIKAYLSDRKFCVRVGDHFSDFTAVSSGVPQGSVLGPLLFLIYVADLPLHVKCKISSFADDSKLYGNPLSD